MVLWLQIKACPWQIIHLAKKEIRLNLCKYVNKFYGKSRVKWPAVIGWAKISKISIFLDPLSSETEKTA